MQISLKSGELKMKANKQSQKAGNGSQQIQVGTMIVNQGATEERIKAIFMEMIPQAIETYTKEAYETATRRIDKLEQNVIPRISAIDGALESFADPAFQKVLRKAQQSAAATEREEDYALLSELLICHIEKGEQRKNRVGISKAIEIIDEIDNDALCALTLAYAVATYFPKTDNIQMGLKVLDKFLSKLWYMEPPTGKEWLEHLELLRAVRLGQGIRLRSIREIYTQKLSGCSCIGIKVDSKEYRKAIEILGEKHINSAILIPNILLDGYVRLPVVNKKGIKDIIIKNGSTFREMTVEEKETVEKVWEMYTVDDTLQKTVNDKFMEIFDSFDTLKKLHVWWDSIAEVFGITQIGIILAYTNAKRCDENLPDLI